MKKLVIVIIAALLANTTSLADNKGAVPSILNLILGDSTPVSIPSAPSDVSASDGSFPDRVAISWSNVSNATSYRAYRCTSSSTSTCSQIYSGTSAGYNDTSATAETTYYYRTTACNSAGCSGYSAFNTGYRAADNCPTDVPTVTTATDQVWMDRNLGASRVATSKNDSAAYGDLYQWGRLTDGHQERLSDITDYNDTSSETTPGHPNFILALTDWLIPSNDNLWQGLNGINNPCPACFRLPTRAEWSAEMNTWAAENSTAAFNSPLKLVVAGIRNRDSGDLYGAGTYGYYWSEDVAGSPAYSYYFGVENSFAGVDTRLRAYGKSVRCIQN